MIEKYSAAPSPCYVIEEEPLRRNLELITDVARRADVEIIMAFKAFAMWSVFPIIREYVSFTTASSVAEARLSFEEMGTLTHSYAPIYTDANIEEFMRYSSHITFNSAAQYERFRERVAGCGRHISCGLRVNPEFSEVETDLYNPCSPGSRLGVLASELGDVLPAGVEGLHFHALCESSSYSLEGLLETFVSRFGHILGQVKWVNMGGGHLITRDDYDTEHLISVLQRFKARFPHLHVILEPGSAFTWRTGVLVSTVEDVVCNNGVRTAMLDVSFACHMPDCLEMPYKPAILGASDAVDGLAAYRMGGNSCLAGDYVGDWSFEREPHVGDRVVFADMIHYTMVKTTMFNGVAHPSIGIIKCDGSFKLIRKFGYEDFKNRLS